MVNYGLAGAYRVSETLSLGLGLTYLDASLIGVADVYAVDDDTVEALFRPNSYLTQRWVNRAVVTIDDSDWSFTAGFLWNVSQRWKVGGVYRQAPEVRIGSFLMAGFLIDYGVPPGAVVDRSSSLRVEFPSFVGLGFAYRAPGDRLTLSFQWDRIGYSKIPESLEIEDQTVADANELHLGGEYVFRRPKTLVAVRVGAWLDPEHQLSTVTDDPLELAFAPPGEDELHYAAGVGLAFKRFQIDVGVDFSERVNTASISAIYSF